MSYALCAIGMLAVKQLGCYTLTLYTRVMQQHPVPQNVTQYQFRLVGDMTLKQFLELAGGLLLAYLFYASNLIFIFKWPLVLLSIFFGIALAFFPLEDRPLDTWIINFVKAIYGPTRFIWKKSDKIPPMFIFEAHPIVNTVTAIKTIKAPVMSAPATPDAGLTESESSKLQALDTLINSMPATAPTLVIPTPAAPDLDRPSVTVRKLKAAEDVAPPPAKPIATLTPTPSAATSTPALSVAAVPTDIIFKSQPQKVVTPAAPASPLKTVALPSAPQTPNMIVGVVTDVGGKLVENAIVQIVDGTGLPARAMKTNALGQFYTATPLGVGNYQIEVEKDGLTYAPQSLQIDNALIPPFEIRATA